MTQSTVISLTACALFHTITALQVCQLPDGAQLTCENSCCRRFESKSKAYADPAYYCCDTESGRLVTEEPIASGLQSSSTNYTALIIIGILLTIGLIVILSLLGYLLYNRMRRRGQIWHVEQQPKAYPAYDYRDRDYPPPMSQGTMQRPYIPRADYPTEPPSTRPGVHYAPEEPRYAPQGPPSDRVPRSDYDSRRF